MKKVKGLANRIVAMLLSGMLIVGTAPGIVLASETRADSGRTSENAGGYPTEETTGATEEFLTEETTGVIEEAPTEETKETAEEPWAEDYSQAAAEPEAVSGEDTGDQEAGYAEENPGMTDVSQQPEETEGAVEAEAGSEETEKSEQSDGAEVFEASGNKTAGAAGASTVSKVISNLTKGRTYYVRVRAYKTVNNVKYVSAWSGTKSVKISK